jgi:hypothetical protein
MQNVAQKWSRRLFFIKGLIAGFILSLIILGNYFGPYAKVKQGQCFVRHIAIMSALKEHLESGQPIPRNLSELAPPEDSDRFRVSRTVKYYPDAWNKPGRILLQSSVCGSYVVTFGDGSRASCLLGIIGLRKNSRTLLN